MSKPFDSLSPNPLRISLSNFDSKKKDHLQVLINKLGGVYNENLEYGTNILVAANALSNKYKVIQFNLFFKEMNQYFLKECNSFKYSNFNQQMALQINRNGLFFAN